jgi:hypothetical protein
MPGKHSCRLARNGSGERSGGVDLIIIIIIIIYLPSSGLSPGGSGYYAYT